MMAKADVFFASIEVEFSGRKDRFLGFFESYIWSLLNVSISGFDL